MGTVYDLTHNYDKRWHRFESTYERIRSLYAFSPEWLRERDAVWQQYDTIEAVRNARGKTVESLYHSYMFHLFRKEFYPVAWEPHFKNVFLLSLQHARSRALSAASSQRIRFAAWTMRPGS